MPTASGIGRNSVATNVVTNATADVGVVLATVNTSCSRSDLAPAAISTAARAGITTWATSVEKMARIRTSHRPAQIAPHRLRAPAVTLTAVCPTDPPTG